MTAFEIATVVVGAVAALGVGAIAAAVITAVATNRRERGAWLRELQINANRDFYAAAQDIVTYVVTGSADEPLIDPNAPPSGAPDAIAIRATNLTQRHLEMMPVSEQRTVDLATTVVQALPCLAYQGVPLPGAATIAALSQRRLAIGAMTLLMVDLTGVMRQDVGLSGWRERRQFTKQKKSSQPVYAAMILSIVDRPHPPEDLGKLLWEWQVQDLSASTVPDTIAGYYVEAKRIPLKHPKGFEPQACAQKPRDGSWRFAIVRGLPTAVESEIIKDMVRLVTGHHNAFRPKHTGQWLSLPDGGRGYVWPSVGG
ncbi:hypothetical protein H5U98_22765 [Mycolicibacterium boenickei]|uniref:Uncharacterized protein n=1 Tax=Mycolicibacterium boenickei TaxID=146017 RepID=A0AAX2ZT82_9MYCO|nr:hypothetical protein [Mycolicibacterium boenickei]UNB98349.1 hypothetical protein H5U98_22765 [Mycolicibacterium boenickei]